jgi:DNA-binding LytR/AlgR family response regulator
MNALIIEDEPLAAERLEQMLADVAPNICVLAKLGSVKDSVRWLMQNQADVIFLDIQLSDGLSFSIFDQVVVSTPIIFTTAYDQYAINAFKLNSISYLLKPIRRDELIESVKKYNQLKSVFSVDFDMLLASISGREPAFKRRFLIQIGDKIKKIEIDEIAYFYVMDKAVYIKLFHGSSYPIEYSLERLEGILDPKSFFRINRKYIVNLSSIVEMVAYSRGRVKLELNPAPDEEFDAIVSIDRSAEFKNWLNS